MSAFVYIAGAGPGDPELVTVKTRTLLSSCDVVIYDSLLDPSLLSLCRPDCEILYAGKRAGVHSMRQEEINSLIVKKAREGKVVLRLKGGDPFVFGRGGEECLALQKAGIPYEVVPGVTSAVSVPMAAGIPVTHRGTSNMVTVITGHSADGELTENLDFSVLSRMKSTLVFLMGLHSLPTICQALLDHGMDPETPAAVISDGTRMDQYVLRSTLRELPGKAQRDPRVVTPAVIVIGACAKMDLRSLCAKPLSGVRISVCGTGAFCEKMALLLSRSGGTVTRLPLLTISPVEDPAFSRALTRLSDYTWLVFTGRNAIRLFFQEFFRENLDLRTLAHLKIAVIGKATGKYLEQYHFHADYCPEQYTSDALADLLISHSGAQDRILIPRAVKGNHILADKLTAEGVNFTEVRLYDTVRNESAADLAQRESPGDFLVFASSEGVRQYFQAGGTIGPKTLPVCIGRYTADTLSHYTDHYVISRTASADGLVDTILTEVLNR